MSQFYIKHNDRLPSLRAELSDSQGLIDLTSGVVTFYYRLKSRASGVNSGSAVVINAASGITEFQWGASNVANPGVYYGEWRVQFSGAKESTFPNDSMFMFELGKRLED